MSNNVLPEGAFFDKETLNCTTSLKEKKNLLNESLYLTLYCRVHNLTPRNYFKWMVHNLIVKTALNCSADCTWCVHWCQIASLSKHFLVILRNVCPYCLIAMFLWIRQPLEKKLKTDSPIPTQFCWNRPSNESSVWFNSSDLLCWALPVMLHYITDVMLHYMSNLMQGCATFQGWTLQMNAMKVFNFLVRKLTKSKFEIYSLIETFGKKFLGNKRVL